MTAGTIGRIRLQIPWTNLWSQSMVVSVEDVHILCGPIVNRSPFDEEKNKRLVRAMKRRALARLEAESEVIGGPASFSEHLVAAIVDNLEFSVSNVHLRYEDEVSAEGCVAAGVCLGSVTAESTNRYVERGH